MKGTLKISLLSMMLSGISLYCGATKPGTYTRIDYINLRGERMNSKYVDNYENLFNVNRNSDNSLSVFGKNGEIAGIDFIPWGEASHSLTLENLNQTEINVTYETITDSDNTEKKLEKANESGDVLCGIQLRFSIRVPEGTYPVVKIAYEYTSCIDGEQYWSTFNSLGLSGLGFTYTNQLQATDLSYRKNLAEAIDGHGQFTRSAEDPRLWHITLTMPNEPMTVRFSYNRPDSKKLSAAVLSALCELYSQHHGVDFNGNSGEPWIMSYFGEAMSQDYVSALFKKGLGNNPNELMLKNNNTIASIPWSDEFAVISHANLVLDRLNAFVDATPDDRAIAKAQLLALRSHAYFRLLQIYGTRWSESGNGTVPCAPLEVGFMLENTPLATMGEIADQCYADLDEAIDIFRSTEFARENIIQPDINVARGIKMRVAMLREDWSTASTLARDILDQTPLTSNEELRSGFFSPAGSWIWGAFNNTVISEEYVNSLYYWSSQSYYACNGTYGVAWGVGGGAIDKNLYLSIPVNDVRRSLFAMPDQVTTRGYTSIDAWHDSSKVDFNSLFAIFPDMQSASKHFADIYSDSKPDGVVSGAFASHNKDYYMPVPFGAQVKFYCPGDNAFSDAATVFMRSDEISLSLAEAYCQLGNDQAAREELTRLNRMRDQEYSCTSSGEELLSEIRRYRRIELWGEGHSWFDLKRWNTPVNRQKWIENNPSSGNWFPSVTEYIPTDYANGWRAMIPAYYVNHNPLVDIESMGYDNPSVYESRSVPERTPESVGRQYRSDRFRTEKQPYPTYESY